MTSISSTDNRGLFQVFFNDGRNLITFTGIVLLFSGLFVTAQSFIGEFLPHDTQYLGMNASQLGSVNQNIVNFMFHDRVSFGGTLISIGLLYMWLSEFPLRQKQAWAWWVLCLSGIVGFASFLSYLGYGYLDSYHGISTLMLIPFYFIGVVKAYRSFDTPPSFKSLKKVAYKPSFKTATGIGYIFLYFTAFGIFSGGLVVMTVGMTTIFVPQDLEYMSMCTADFTAINPKLAPLIAHDRASFGGGLACIGLVIYFVIRCAEPTKNLWQILFITLSIGFISGICIHFYIGYLSFTHLAPAYFGALCFVVGIGLTYKFMTKNA